MDTVKAGYDFNYAPIRTAYKDLSMPYAICGDENVVLETVKQGEDGGVVLRLYEAMGSSAKIGLTCEGEIVECNILEDEVKSLGNGQAEISFAPFEIKTIKIN